MLEALGNRLHSDPAMDGYIKWQLLSFKPDITGAKGSQLKSILANLPPILPQPHLDYSSPKPPGDAVTFGLKGELPAYMPRISPINAQTGLYRIDPQASAVSSGGGVSGKQTTINADLRDRKKQTQQVLNGSNQLRKLQDIIDRLNTPSLGYRDAIIEKLPQSGGLKMAASFVDLDDRLRAGDRSYPDAAERFIAEVNYSADNRLADRGTRKTILNNMQQLYRVRLEFFREIEVQDINRFRVQVEKVRLDEEDFKEAFIALQK